jgi:hypothetical protein
MQKTEKEEIFEISQLTGRSFREILYFNEIENKNKANNYLENRKGEYKDRLDKMLNEFDKSKTDSFLKTLEGLFLLGFVGGPPKTMDYNVYDRGIMYFQENEVHILNEPARVVLFQQYLTLSTEDDNPI